MAALNHYECLAGFQTVWNEVQHLILAQYTLRRW
jgi:hypothetical protein